MNIFFDLCNLGTQLRGVVMRYFISLCFFLGLFFVFWSCADQSSGQEQVSFNYDIAPIFSNNCYLCHGNDPESREAGLRLDLESAAKSKLESGKIAIVPFDPEGSELIQRIMHDDPDEIMPPQKTKKILTKREIELLKNWIAQGAKWERHWAFQPVKEKEIGKSRKNRFNQIDDYINDQCHREGIKIYPEADPYSLVKRVSLLVTGLLPSREEIDRFADNTSYSEMVDYYLASAGYGERWARHWMDLVRYAEARGHEFDFNIPGAWQYRDYLVKALNQDVPYDQLIKEHLAGDLLQQPRNDENNISQSSIGTAFYALGEGTHSPVDIKKDEADRIDNMIDVTSKTFLGMTMSCARCHDHKFDPIPTADYYAWYGIMESARFHYHSVQNMDKVETTLAQVEEIDQEIKQYLSGMPKYAVPVVLSEDQPNFHKIADFSQGQSENWYFDGTAFGSGNAKGQLLFGKDKILGVHQGKISSRFFGYGLSGAARSPTFKIRSDYLHVRTAGKHASIRVVIDNFQLIRNPIYGNLNQQVNSDEWKDISIDLSMWKGHLAYIEVLPALLLDGKQMPPYEWDQDSSSWIEVQHVYQSNVKEEKFKSKPRLYKPLSKPLWDNAEILKKINQRHDLLKEIRDTSFYMGVTSGSSVESPVFIRGDHQQLDSVTQNHRLLTTLSDQVFTDDRSSRLQLAEAIASPQNPLTARVLVNRIWSHLFGKGIVTSVDNFGRLGELPTHPELLDHLASYLIQHNWSLKKTIRYILHSHTFRRQSVAESPVEDPTNKWLGFYEIRRMEAEAIRDVMLQVSQKLNRQMYGKPVPVYLNEFMEGRGKPISGPLDGEGRRSIYLSMRRNFLNSFLLAFDMPQPVTTFGKRNQTTVPAQSLTLMNDPFVKDCANHWAQRMLDSELSDEKKIYELYLSAFCRPPSDEEVQKSQEFLEQQYLLHLDHDDKGEARQAGWEDLCHSVFNMKEFIYIF